MLEFAHVWAAGPGRRTFSAEAEENQCLGVFGSRGDGTPPHDGINGWSPPRSLACSVMLDWWEPRGMETPISAWDLRQMGSHTAPMAPGRPWVGMLWLSQWHQKGQQKGFTTFKVQNLLCLKGRGPTLPPSHPSSMAHRKGLKVRGSWVTSSKNLLWKVKCYLFTGLCAE